MQIMYSAHGVKLGSNTIYPTDGGHKPDAVPPAVAVALKGELIHVAVPQRDGWRGAGAADPVGLLAEARLCTTGNMNNY